MQISQAAKVPILTYHSVDESGSIISTAPDVFRQQMKSLSASGYKAISLKELLGFFSENKIPAPKTVALTFDDGFQNFYTTAFPVLQEYGFQATVFLVTDHCGKYNDWGDNPPKLPRSKLLSWQEIKELNDCGIEFGSHTRTHPDLTQIDAAQADREIVESKQEIENALGTEVTTFAYPYGKFNPSVKQVAEKTFAAACSTNLGKARRTSDFFSLERIDTYYLSNPRIFNSLSSRAFDRYLRVRQAMRDFKSLISPNK
jgi:peptidoglycan/xylan/chitin deacetylase (PgdA/CDA1 family)